MQTSNQGLAAHEVVKIGIFSVTVEESALVQRTIVLQSPRKLADESSEKNYCSLV